MVSPVLNIGGLAWLVSALAWTFFSLRLWRTFITDRSKVSSAFFYFSLCFSIASASIGLSQTFFGNNYDLMRVGLTLTTFFNALGFSTLGYLVFYLKFPNGLPKFGFLFLFIFGMVITLLNIIFPYQLVSRGLFTGYNYHPLPGILMFILIISVSLPLGILLLKKSKTLLNPEERIKTFGLGTLCLSGVGVAALFAVFPYLVREVVVFRSIVLIGWSLGIIFLTFFTQRAPIEKSLAAPGEE